MNFSLSIRPFPVTMLLSCQNQHKNKNSQPAQAAMQVTTLDLGKLETVQALFLQNLKGKLEGWLRSQTMAETRQVTFWNKNCKRGNTLISKL